MKRTALLKAAPDGLVALAQLSAQVARAGVRRCAAPLPCLQHRLRRRQLRRQLRAALARARPLLAQRVRFRLRLAQRGVQRGELGLRTRLSRRQLGFLNGARAFSCASSCAEAPSTRLATPSWVRSPAASASAATLASWGRVSRAHPIPGTSLPRLLRQELVGQNVVVRVQRLQVVLRVAQRALREGQLHAGIRPLHRHRERGIRRLARRRVGRHGAGRQAGARLGRGRLLLAHFELEAQHLHFVGRQSRRGRSLRGLAPCRLHLRQSLAQQRLS